MRPLVRPMSSAASLGASLAVLLLAASLPRASSGAPAWAGHAGNGQHTASSPNAAQPLRQIVWQLPIDLNRNFIGIHYGSCVVTDANTVIVPIKVGFADTFRVEAHQGSDGTFMWQFDPGYRLPPRTSNTWIPAYGPVMTPGGRLYVPGPGGTLHYTDTPDGPGTPTFTQVAFYDIANYDAAPAAYNADIQICSPLTSDANGNIFFAYRSTGANPLSINQGIARMGANGSGTFVTAFAMTDSVNAQMPFNGAPVLNPDETKLYAGIKRNANSSSAILVSVDATTLAPIAKVMTREPLVNNTGLLSNLGSSTPMVGPDGRVYLGVLDNPLDSNGRRGWLLQFDANLNPIQPPGGFGWDVTPSVVPASAVPSYTGLSTYLLMTKYNNYAGIPGGDGVNKIAILDPNDSQIDPAPHTGATIMKEVLTIACPTPDPNAPPEFPNAVREWCINTAAVDPITGCAIANCEDGILYRWDLATNTLSESVQLTGGVPEAYTPTLIGRDGKSYAINDAVLFAVGIGTTAVGDNPAPSGRLALAAARPSPFGESVTLRFTLPRADHARLDVFDITGRRIARLVDEPLSAGEHVARWDGRDVDGRRAAAGVYFARLSAGSESAARILVRAH